VCVFCRFMRCLIHPITYVVLLVARPVEPASVPLSHRTGRPSGGARCSRAVQEL